MISLKTTLDKRRAKLDGTYPLVFRISYKGVSRDVSSGFTCKLSDWDFNLECIKSKNPESQITQQRIRNSWLSLQEKLIELERKGIDPCMTINEIKNFVTGAQLTFSLAHDLWQHEIQRMELSKKFGNARNYRSAYGGISKVSSLHVPLKKIDFSWLMKLESGLLNRGVNMNSVSVYMRTLRAVYNKAINLGLADAADYPFRRYKITSTGTTPRVASTNEVKLFFSYNSQPGSFHFNAWNYGKLIFLLRGINFTDLALLTRENIKHDRIIYKRAKTHKDYSVKLLPLAKKILETYFDEDRTTLLPILTNQEYLNKKCLPDRLHQLRKTTNKWLRFIGKQIGTQVDISTYVFRYSHANVCKSLGYSKDIISESLGHGYGLAVSSCYLENYNIDLIDEMNEKVCDAVVSA